MANEKRLIDANELMSEVHRYDEQQKTDVWLTSDIAALLAEQPTVDAVEVVHSEWTMVIDENDCECIECPLCGEQFYDGDNDTFDRPYNYCPNCGARMDGDGNEID